ncbi:hypothetical protein D3C76_1529830 [compost metagenome]
MLSRFSASASHTCGSDALAAVDNRLRPQAAWPRPGPTTSTLAWWSKPINWFAEWVPCTMTSGKRVSAADTCSLRVAIETIPAPQRRALSALIWIAPPKPRSPPINST